MSAMKKLISVFSSFLFSFALLYANEFKSFLVPDLNESVVYVGAYDWGACIDKIVINVGIMVSPSAVRAPDFKVNQILYVKNGSLGMAKGELSVVDAFCSDSTGSQIYEPSSYITVLTDVYPEAENSSPFVSLSLGDRFEKMYGYRVENDELDISIKKMKGFVNSLASCFEVDSFSYTYPATEEDLADPKYKEESVTLPYASFIPQDNSGKKIPLILWFHGMGESGDNIYKVLFGTKTTALVDKGIQGYFSDGVAVLAPQCPSGWLQVKEKGAFGIRYWAPIDKEAPVNAVKKPVSKFLGKFFVKKEREKVPIEKIPFAAVSYYTEPVSALLDKFLGENPQIDINRIYVGGCSAGGYMTMNMMIQCPERFAAAFPICEYYLDSKITDSQIRSLAKKPLWFTYALNDGSVNPEKNSIPTIKRLLSAGADNVHYSEFRNVVDLSGNYLMNRTADRDDEDFGLPYEYEGHWSWIYVLNDVCNDGDLKMFEWLSNQ